VGFVCGCAAANYHVFKLVKMWRLRKRRIYKKRASTVTKHYLAHKELARTLVHARLQYFNQHYQFSYKRVAIKNQRRCWGSCSSLQNLNFNYKLYFLPPHLCDYIIVHELCHLAELNHGQKFWDLVEQQIPDYKKCVAELKAIDRLGGSIQMLEAVQAKYSEQEQMVVC
jgi:predicted metal-dependent hydrolase